MARIHATAMVERQAELGDDVEVAAYAVIGAHVRIGEGTRIGPHTVIEGHTTIGRDNRIFQFCSVGAAPQDKKYAWRAHPAGDRRPQHDPRVLHLQHRHGAGRRCHAHRHDNWIMAYVHVAHDCQFGSHTIIANSTQLGGPCAAGRLGLPGRLHRRAPVRACRRARNDRLPDAAVAGPAALRHRLGQPGRGAGLQPKA
jgi:UDP-N-acetylglucosamine acyltransferase